MTPPDYDVREFIESVELWASRDFGVHADRPRDGATPLCARRGRTARVPDDYEGQATLIAVAFDGTRLARWPVTVRPGETVSVA